MAKGEAQDSLKLVDGIIVKLNNEESYMNDFMIYTKKVYEHLADEKSRIIYSNRILYTLTGDIRYMRLIIQMIYPDLNQAQNMKGIIFGAGTRGSAFQRMWSNVKWTYFTDNDKRKWNTYIAGIKVISPNQMVKNLGTDKIFICIKDYNLEIEKQLLKMGVSSAQIVNISRIVDDLNDKQYFDLYALHYSDDEVFVDAGSFDGRTSLNFINYCGGKYKHIYAFEADPKNISKIEKTFLKINDAHDKLDIIPKGLWNCQDTLKFNSCGDMGSSLNKLGLVDTTVTNLDDELGDNVVTFIKMDIEGAELKALQGAEKIIRGQKPKLAISVYHKMSDIFDIPDLLLQYNPEYRFYIRHYSLAETETVLYAL